MPEETIIDRVISYLSPQLGFKRARFREFNEYYTTKRRYEAAGIGKRTSGWIAPNTGPNAEIFPGLHLLRSRSRDLVRNNPYAARAVQVIASNVVSYGIIPEQKNPNFDKAWKSWGDTLQCDADGQNNFYGLQALIMREIVEAGEVLVRKIYPRASDGLTVPLQLQVIESDFIYDLLNIKLENGNIIKQGIEFDPRGKRVAYHLYSNHPGELNLLGTSFIPIRVPANEILHIYRMDRAGQIRGVPWGAPVLLKLKDFDDYDDAQLMRQKMAACFAAFLSDKEVSEALGPNPLTDTELQYITPGTIAKLPPGKEITFGNPPGVGLDYAPYAAVTLRSIAAGYGVTYEALTQDLSQINFSSGRLGWLEFHRNIDQWRYHMLIPNLCEKVWSWFVEATELAGLASSKRLVQIGWTPPRREMIQPVEETEANIAAIRGGLKTLSEAIREQGNDPEKQLEEMKKDNEILDEYGFKLDSDSRQPKNGAAPMRENTTSHNISK